MVLLALSLTAVMFAQQQNNIVPDNRLYSRYQSDDINNMMANSPQDIKYWNWYLDNGYVVKQTSPELAQKFPALKFYDKDTKMAAEEEVAYVEGSFNIMAYDIDIQIDRTRTYRIGDTGYIVNVLPSSKLVEKYNKFLENEQ